MSAAKFDCREPWHLVWNHPRRPAVKEPGFYGELLRCLRGMRKSTFKKALAEVAWWDLAEMRCNPTPERILLEIKGYGFKRDERTPVFTLEEEKKLAAKLVELGWTFSRKGTTKAEAEEA